ncbi:hypothetical protein NEPAR04_2072 [Nematocida parisii]|nr:hypothetical protein NEPAR03_0939 [Nematocida parisii]KAI5130610.1 hypothetical protein NEPAR08_2119 [Nematocida parisii]KAI5144095.1 hypothetical protein NEPAR04_2072 [Nematocida parisii]
MREMIRTLIIVYAIISLSHKCFGKYIFDERLVLFSDDRQTKVLIDKELVQGFTTHSITYSRDWINGKYTKRITDDTLYDLSTVGSLPIPKEYFKGLEEFFSMTGIIRYSENRKMDFSEFVDVIWGWTHFHLDPNEVLIDIPESARPFTKVECFKENLLLLLRANPRIRNTLQSVINEINRINLPNSPLPAYKMVPRDKIQWFLNAKQHNWIKRFLELCLCRRIGNISLHAKVTENIHERSTVQLTVRPYTKRTARQSTELFSTFIMNNSTYTFSNMNIQIEENTIISASIMNDLFVIFGRTDTLILDHPGGVSHIKEYSALLTSILRDEVIRKQNHSISLLKGLILSHTLFITEKALEYLEKTDITKFGFKKYYPPSYRAEKAYHTIQNMINNFISRLLTGQSPISSSLEYLLGPDRLFFSKHVKYDNLPKLDTIEIHVSNTVKSVNRSTFTIPSTSTVKTVVLVEDVTASARDTYNVLYGISSLRHLTTLDVKRTTVNPMKVIPILLDINTKYKTTIRAIEFPYAPGTTTAHEWPISSFIKSVPSIRKYGIYVPANNPERTLLPLIRDIQDTFKTASAGTRVNLTIRNISITSYHGISSYTVTPHYINRRMFMSVYKTLPLPVVGSGKYPAADEILRVLSKATALDNTPKNSAR